MKRSLLLSVVACVFTAGLIRADTFGTGDNQFEIEFVTISGDASSANGTDIGSNNPEGFIDPGYNYRMGILEITNDQWNKFKNEYGMVTGSPSHAYDEVPFWTGTNVPLNNISWYESAQFVNWLNASNEHQAAYKFTGTQGTSDYILGVWDVTDAGYDASNPYRNSNAYYFLPTEDEWVKAAYWNGTNMQNWPTPDGTQPLEDIEANYGDESGAQPWDVGSGSEELNGTFDMVGNVVEWMESPYDPGRYLSGANRVVRGGSYRLSDGHIMSSWRYFASPNIESINYGFRVASVVPEPASFLLLCIGGLLIRKR